MRYPVRSSLWIPLLVLTLLIIGFALWEQDRMSIKLQALARIQATELAAQLQEQIQQARSAEQILRETLDDQLFAAAWLAATRATRERDWSPLLQQGGVAHLAWFGTDGRLLGSTAPARLSGHLKAAIPATMFAGPLRERRLGIIDSEPASVYAVAVYSKGVGVVVAAIRAEEFKALRHGMGIGRAIRRAGERADVRYALLLDRDQILAASEHLPAWIQAEGDPRPSHQAEAVVAIPASQGGGFDCLVPLDGTGPPWLRVGLLSGPIADLERRGIIGLWLRTLSLLALALTLLAWLMSRLRVRELDRERIRVTEEVTRLAARKARDERIVALGHLASGMAHELRNPLNTVAMTAQRLELEYQPTEDLDGWTTLLGAMRGETRRMQRSIEQFLQVARPAKTQRQPHDMVKLLQEMITLQESQFKELGIELRTELDPVGLVDLDADQIRQALGNLLDNARRALELVSPGKRRLIVRLSGTSDQIELVVEDSGPGVPHELRFQVFDLYFTTRSDGTGMGLALAQRSAADHGGSLVCESSPLGGALFRFSMERHDHAASSVAG